MNAQGELKEDQRAGYCYGAWEEKDVIKKSRLINEDIKIVSFVDKAANLNNFLVVKGENGASKLGSVHPIIKCDKETHTVVGIVSEPDVKDHHDDWNTVEDIAKSKESFDTNGYKFDTNHDLNIVDEGIKVVKSWLAEEDSIIEEKEIKKGTWLMEFEISEDTEIWKGIEEGSITGLSRFGTGEKIETEPETIEKGILTDTIKSQNLMNLMADTWWVLDDLRWEAVHNGGSMEDFKNGVNEFNDIMNSAIDEMNSDDISTIMKSIKEDKRLKPEEIKKMQDDNQALTDEKTALEKEVADLKAEKAAAAEEKEKVELTEICEEAGVEIAEGASNEEIKKSYIAKKCGEMDLEGMDLNTAFTVAKSIKQTIIKKAEPKGTETKIDAISKAMGHSK